MASFAGVKFREWFGATAPLQVRIPDSKWQELKTERQRLVRQRDLRWAETMHPSSSDEYAPSVPGSFDVMELVVLVGLVVTLVWKLAGRRVPRKRETAIRPNPRTARRALYAALSLSAGGAVAEVGRTSSRRPAVVWPPEATVPVPSVRGQIA